MFEIYTQPTNIGFDDEIKKSNDDKCLLFICKCSFYPEAIINRVNQKTSKYFNLCLICCNFSHL